MTTTRAQIGGSIFISYRRQDAAEQATRLYDSLVGHYGAHRVMFDIADLEPGASFAEKLQAAVASCEVVLVVIGPSWSVATDSRGQRRLDDPGDFIRHEVASALASGKMVVPVLVGGAVLPHQDALPGDLRPLVYRHAVSLRYQSWESDIRILLRALDGLQPAAPAPTAAPAGAPRPGSLLSRLKAAWRVLSQGGHATRSEVRTPIPDALVSPGTDAEVAPPAPGHLVFVSYVNEDRSAADEIVRELEAAGHRCWISHRELVGGEDSWPGAVVGAIAASRVVVILVTKYSVNAKHVLREVTIADNENVPMVALCADKTPLSRDLKYFFTASQRLDVSDIPWSQALTQLQGAVDRRLA